MSLIDAKNVPKVAWQVLRTSLTRANVPLKISHYITYRCNLQCKYCGRISVKAKELTTDEVKNCMHIFRSMGTEFWGLSGGEPLMRKDLGELVKWAKSLGLRMSVSTNGVIVPNRIDELRDIDLAIVSLDGDKSVHDGLRGEGTYDAALKAAEVLRSNNIDVLFFSVLSNMIDETKIRETVKASKAYGARCEFQPLVIHRSDLRKVTEAYKPESMARQVNFIRKLKAEGAPVANSFGMLDLLLKYPSFPQQSCWSKKLFCAISPDGRVLPCSEMLEHGSRYPKGTEVGWKEAFNKLPDMKNCRECFFSCYTEYNLVLNNPLKVAPKIFSNVLSGRWLWQ